MGGGESNKKKLGKLGECSRSEQWGWRGRGEWGKGGMGEGKGGRGRGKINNIYKKSKKRSFKSTYGSQNYNCTYIIYTSIISTTKSPYILTIIHKRVDLILYFFLDSVTH